VSDHSDRRLVTVDADTYKFPQRVLDALELATGGGVEYAVPSPQGTWTINHGLGRRPTVTIYLASGEEAEADVFSSATQVVVTFPIPTSGYVVLT